MEHNIQYILQKVLKLESLYEQIFGRKGMGEFMRLVWHNIKYELGNDPSFANLSWRLMIEEMMVYMVALKGKTGYDRVTKNPQYENLIKKENVIICEYEDFEKCYKKFLEILRDYFEKNDYKEEIFKG